MKINYILTGWFISPKSLFLHEIWLECSFIGVVSNACCILERLTLEFYVYQCEKTSKRHSMGNHTSQSYHPGLLDRGVVEMNKIMEMITKSLPSTLMVGFLFTLKQC